MVDSLRAAIGALPTCEVGADSVIVRLPSGPDMVTFTFEEISIRAQKFDAVLSVDSGMGVYSDDPPYRQHLTCSSGSNVNAFRLMLEHYFGHEIEWKRMLPKACQMAQANYIAASTLVRPEDVAIEKAWWWHVAGLFIGNRLNIVFGQGESAKSYLVQSIVESCAGTTNDNGATPWEGRQTAGSNWIWLDYENPTAEAFAFRRKRLGLAPLDGAIHWMPGRGVPIADLKPTLLREIRNVDAQGLIVDSLTFGCGGDPREPAVAQTACNTLNNLGVTVVAIAHVTKDENADQYPFGSILWHLGPHGLTWNLKRVSEEGSDEVVVGWYNRKASDGGRQKSFGTRMLFTGEDGPVTIQSCKLADTALAPTASIGDRIWKMLESGRLGEDQIAEMLKAKPDSVRRTAERMQSGGLLVPSWDGGKRFWGRKSRWEGDG